VSFNLGFIQNTLTSLGNAMDDRHTIGRSNQNELKREIYALYSFITVQKIAFCRSSKKNIGR
jgi:hypothetical protein